MFFSGFSKFLTRPVKDSGVVSAFKTIGYSPLAFTFLAFILMTGSGCNLTVHRSDGLQKAQLGPPVHARVLRPDVADINDSPQNGEVQSAEGQQSAEPEDESVRPESENLAQPGETQGQQVTENTEIAPRIEAGGISSEKNGESPPAADIASSGEVKAPLVKAVKVPGETVEEQGNEPRAILASLKIPGGAKLSPLPIRPDSLPPENLVTSFSTDEESGEEAPETVSPETETGSTELTSSVIPTVSPLQEAAESEKPAEEKKPEDEPPGTGGGESSGDGEGGKEETAAAEPAEEGGKGGKFPYGIVFVLVVCLGIAIFQNTAGKSI